MIPASAAAGMKDMMKPFDFDVLIESLVAQAIDSQIVFSPVMWLPASDGSGDETWGFIIATADTNGLRGDQIDAWNYETTVETRAELIKELSLCRPSLVLHDARDVL